MIKTCCICDKGINPGTRYLSQPIPLVHPKVIGEYRLFSIRRIRHPYCNKLNLFLSYPSPPPFETVLDARFVMAYCRWIELVIGLFRKDEMIQQH